MGFAEFTAITANSVATGISTNSSLRRERRARISPPRTLRELCVISALASIRDEKPCAGLLPSTEKETPGLRASYHSVKRCVRTDMVREPETRISGDLAPLGKPNDKRSRSE